MSHDAASIAKAGLKTGNKPSHNSPVRPNFSGVEIQHAPSHLIWNGHGHAPVSTTVPHRTTNPTREELIARGRVRK